MSSTRQIVPLSVADVSSFAKILRDAFIAAPTPPSHLAFLNLVAKSAGYRNYQALRAAATSATNTTPARLATTATAPAPARPRAIELPRDIALTRTAARAVSHFDAQGKLLRFPTQLSVRLIALWGLWCRLPAKRELSESQVNATIAAFHCFNDNATLRRELVNAKLLWRTTDGRVYKKVAKPPDEEAQAFLKALLRATANQAA